MTEQLFKETCQVSLLTGSESRQELMQVVGVIGDRLINQIKSSLSE